MTAEELEEELREMKWEIFVIRDQALAVAPKLPAVYSEPMQEAAERMLLLCDQLGKAESQVAESSEAEGGTAAVRASLAEIRQSLQEIRRDLLGPLFAKLREMGWRPSSEAQAPAEPIH